MNLIVISDNVYCEYRVMGGDNLKNKSHIVIRDPIYGFIELDAQEQEIINSPHFQRLRRIKQLSLTDMVYPSACHTRFEHSLGVMQMATDMFANIVKNKQNCSLLNLDTGDIPRIKKIIRLAALLHDIGHPPFSHAGENTMPHINGADGPKYDHENYSIAIIKEFFKEIIEDHLHAKNKNLQVDEVTFLLGDDTPRVYGYLLIWKELISGQIDADRADYLLRDSLHIGVQYGTYDRNRLVNCITIAKTETGALTIAIKDGGRHIAESLVLARYQMFSQVYFHKTRRCFDHHVGMMMKEVLGSSDNKGGVFPPPTSKEKLLQYLDFDDWSMMGAMKAGKGGDHGRRILERKPFKCVGEWEGNITDDMQAQITDLTNTHATHEQYLDENVSTKWYKLDKDIWLLDNNILYPLSEKSKIIKAIGQPKITRLYVER